MLNPMLVMKFKKLVKDYTMSGLVQCFIEYLVKHPVADYDEQLAVDLNEVLAKWQERRADS